MLQRVIEISLGGKMQKTQKYFIGYAGENGASKLKFILPAGETAEEIMLYFKLMDSVYVINLTGTEFVVPSGLLNGEEIVLSAVIKLADNMRYISESIVLYSAGSVATGTAEDLGNLRRISIPPTRTSELINDSGFATISYADQKANSLSVSGNEISLLSGSVTLAKAQLKKPFALVYDITLTENTSLLNISKDKSGNDFSFTELMIISKTKSLNGSNTFAVNLSGNVFYAGADSKTAFQSRGLSFVRQDIEDGNYYLCEYSRNLYPVEPGAKASSLLSFSTAKISSVIIGIAGSDSFVPGSSFKIYGR